MKRWYMILFAFLAAHSFAAAQVVADFETNLNGFSNANFGTALTGVSRIADPTAQSTGVMKLVWNYPGNFKANGAVSAKNAIVTNGARFITYWVYIPDSIPANFSVQVFAQDSKNFSFNGPSMDGSTIPRHTWYPISMDLAQTEINVPAFDLVTGNIFQTGIQINNDRDTVSAWHDSIYVDNVALVGTVPTSLADYETGLNGFSNPNFGPALTSVSRMADPTAKSSGVMELVWDFPGNSPTKGAVSAKNAIPATGARFITYWIYVPDSIPARFSVQIFAQDSKNFSFNGVTVDGSSIPRRTWYPISMDLAQTEINVPAFDLVTGNIFQTGIQISNGNDTVSAWHDSIYVDNVALLGIPVPIPTKKFVVSNFTNSGDVAGFAKEPFGPAFTAVSNAVDTTNAANRILSVTCAFDTGAFVKGALSRSNLGIFSPSDDTTATDITIDVFIPTGMPDSARFDAVYKGTATGGVWVQDEVLLAGGSNDLHKGQWNTLKFSVTNHKADITNRRATATFYVQAYYNSPRIWSGRLFFDNLTLVGIAGAPSAVLPIAAPYEYRLDNNYPNPFNPSTTIRYELKAEGKVSLKVYDLLGQEIATLVDGQQAAGPHSIQFDARRLASGVYFYTLRASSFTRTEKMMLLK